MGDENQTIDLIKNLLTQTKDKREKPNNSEKESNWSEEAHYSIQSQDADNAWKKILSHVVKEMRAMCNSLALLYILKKVKTCEIAKIS